jgi:hypothetical protein
VPQVYAISQWRLNYPLAQKLQKPPNVTISTDLPSTAMPNGSPVGHADHRWL